MNSVLGSGRSTSRGNQAYHCPFCHHHKPKMEINFTENASGANPWHCWVCHKRGKYIAGLFRAIEAPEDKIIEAKQYIKGNTNTNYKPKESKDLRLPKEYIPLQNLSKNNIIAKHALHYLKKRGITKDDILKYDMGYCEQGKYQNMIIIPSYDENQKLNYFIARNFNTNYRLKYKNPPASKDIIPFELFINFNSPLILCEGVFDAITIKRNAIPLLGKYCNKSLMRKIVTSKVKKIYIALDSDAIKDSLKHCEQFMNEGKEVYLVELKHQDPNELGFDKITKLIQKTEPLSYSSLLEKKIQSV